MNEKEAYFKVIMKTKEYKHKTGYRGFVFTGREGSDSCTLDKENPQLKTGPFIFAGYIYVQDDPVGMILLHRQSEDKLEKKYCIYCGIEQNIDIWDTFVNDDGCSEEYCIQYIFHLEMTESYKRRENAGNIFYCIAKHYHEMECEENSKDLAVFWYGMAAEQGNFEAVHELGDIYLREGYGWREIELDCGTPAIEMNNGDSVKAAEKWYKMAAEQGDAWSMYELGRLYCFEGKHVYPPWNPADGVPWLEKAYENGIKKAARELAGFLMGGMWKDEICYRNHKKCLYYLKKIAKEDAWAQGEIAKISLTHKNKKTSDKNRLTDEMRRILKGKSLDDQQEYFKLKIIEHCRSWQPAEGGKEETVFSREETTYGLGEYAMTDQDKTVITAEGCIVGYTYQYAKEKITLWACDEEAVELYRRSGDFWKCEDKGGGGYDKTVFAKLIFETDGDKETRYRNSKYFRKGNGKAEDQPWNGIGRENTGNIC
ncbi:MAG: sel1 repeat family protein [Lachnospiraceae bacterium]|nr:sel1 repeat family protein [Lachnospiraceae bacterium]MCM1233731.1 sel1 repeat family protein [Ruminococcus flavefaciens]